VQITFLYKYDIHLPLKIYDIHLIFSMHLGLRLFLITILLVVDLIFVDQMDNVYANIL